MWRKGLAFNVCFGFLCVCVCMSVCWVRDVESSTSVAWMFNLIFGGRVAVAPECAFRYMCEYLCVYAEDLRSFMATELGFHSCLIYTFPGTGSNLHKIFIKANSCSTTIIKWFFVFINEKVGNIFPYNFDEKKMIRSIKSMLVISNFNVCVTSARDVRMSSNQIKYECHF